MEVNFKQTLFSIEPRNQNCNDCGDKNVTHVSVNNGITLCELCTEIHKNFGNQISYLRSIDDQFDDYLMGFFIYGGNKKFRKTLRQMGVDLDQKKGNLYRTYGVDFYRRNLKSIVKGNSRLDKDYENANEIMKNDSHSFPEFENYIINQNNDIFPMQNNNNNMNLNNNNNINELNGLDLNIDLGLGLGNDNYTAGVDVLNNPDENFMNNNEVFNNNKEIQINPEEKKLEAIQNEPEKTPEKENEVNKGKVKVEEEDEDSADRRVKKLVGMSVNGVKKLGNLMKIGGIKGFFLAKKYGKATVNVTKQYVKEKVSNFNKGKGAKDKEKK